MWLNWTGQKISKEGQTVKEKLSECLENCCSSPPGSKIERNEEFLHSTVMRHWLTANLKVTEEVQWWSP